MVHIVGTVLLFLRWIKVAILDNVLVQVTDSFNIILNVYPVPVDLLVFNLNLNFGHIRSFRYPILELSVWSIGLNVYVDQCLPTYLNKQSNTLRILSNRHVDTVPTTG